MMCAAGRHGRLADATRHVIAGAIRSVVVLAVGGQLCVSPVEAQAPHGRSVIEALSYDSLDFPRPEVDRHVIDGVSVMVLEDPSLPMVTVYAYLRGGYGLFGRENYAAASGLPALLRYGGTETRTATQVDEFLEFHALQTSFGSAGGSVTSSMNTLTRNLGPALELWGEMLARPAFEAAETEAWRSRQLESVLRRIDDPGRLAFSEMNRLLYGDHPIGWEMDASDLEPTRLTSGVIREIHRRIVCRENLTLGASGDAPWVEIEPLLRRFIESVPQCRESLPDPPEPVIRRAPGVFLIDRPLAQSVIVMAHPTDVHLADDPRYYAAMIGNSVLGGGGFSSRILGRVRTEEGFAYSASSVWTTPREHEGILAATTRTRPENTGPAIQVILETMGDLRTEAPREDEVQSTVDRLVNGFVFSFDSPGQIVSRQMYYQAQELPADWLQRYMAGVGLIRPDDVLTVFSEELHPEQMTILVVGDASVIRDQLSAFGPITSIEVR